MDPMTNPRRILARYSNGKTLERPMPDSFPVSFARPMFIFTNGARGVDAKGERERAASERSQCKLPLSRPGLNA